MPATPLLRVGCAAGFSGDRTDAAGPVVDALIAAGGPAVLIFETLAERTLALAQLARRSDPAAGVIEGQDVTGLFRFVDDFAIRISSAGGGARIDMRSKSRVGKGDFGANADRIRKVFSSL